MLLRLWAACKRAVPIIGLVALAAAVSAVCGTALVPAGWSAWVFTLLIVVVVTIGVFLLLGVTERTGWTIVALVMGFLFVVSSMLSAGTVLLEARGKTTDARVVDQHVVHGAKSSDPNFVYALVDGSSRLLPGELALQADKPPLQRGDHVRVVYDPSGWAHPMREVDFVENAGSWAGTLILGLITVALSVLACLERPTTRRLGTLPDSHG